MKETVLRFEEMQDEHLDMMLTLAFQQEQIDEAQKIIQQTELDGSQTDEVIEKETLHLVHQKLDKLEQAEKRQATRQRIRRHLPKIIEIAACVVLVFGIAAPVAIANVASIRAKVMKLLIDIDENAGELNVHFEEDTQAGFDVPAEWKGSYYPSAIPENMTLIECGEEDSFVEYSSEQGQMFSFAEYDHTTVMTAGTEGGSISYSTISGSLAYITETTDAEGLDVRVVWANDTNWFTLQTHNMSREETIQIASSVKKIIR